MCSGVAGKHGSVGCDLIGRAGGAFKREQGNWQHETGQRSGPLQGCGEWAAAGVWGSGPLQGCEEWAAAGVWGSGSLQGCGERAAAGVSQRENFCFVV